MTKKEPALVSLCIPVYNGGAMLHRAIESCLRQSYQNIEIIVGDNASEDETAEIARQYSLLDKRVRYFRNERNIGAPENFIKLFRAASGKFVQLLGHDDWLSSNYVEECVACFEKFPTSGAAVGKTLSLAARAIENESYFTGNGMVAFKPGAYSANYILKRAYKTQWGSIGFASMMRRLDALSSIGLQNFNNEYYRKIYTMKVPMIIDHLFFIKAILNYPLVVHTNKATYIKTTHASNYSRVADIERGLAADETCSYYTAVENGYKSVYAYELKRYLAGLYLYFFVELTVYLLKLLAHNRLRGARASFVCALAKFKRYSPRERFYILLLGLPLFCLRVIKFIGRNFADRFWKFKMAPSLLKECFLVKLGTSIDGKDHYAYLGYSIDMTH